MDVKPGIGKKMFEALKEIRPDIALSLKDTEADPTDNDDNMLVFIDEVQQQCQGDETVAAVLFGTLLAHTGQYPQ